MRLNLIFGAPVHADKSNVGKLERIIVNNGIANQITVDPGLLGYERVVPISDFEQAGDDGIHLRTSDSEWKAYPAYKMDQLIDNPNEDRPNLDVLTTDITVNARAVDTEHPLGTGSRAERRTVDEMSVVLTSGTDVVFESGDGGTHKLRGIVIETGRPQALLVDGRDAVDFQTVTELDENRIHVGGVHQQPVLESDRGYEQTRAEDPAGDQRR